MKDSYYSEKAGVVLKSFSEKDFTLLRNHRDTRRVQLWFEGYFTPNLNFLLECKNIENVAIYGGKIDDYSALTQLPKLKSLFLNGRLRRWADNFDFLNEIHSLKGLGILNYPMLTQFPYLGDCTLLESVQISGCKRLTDISNVSSIANLKAFGIVSKTINVEDLEFIASRPGMERMSGAFGSEKKFEKFREMLSKYGLAYG